MWPIPVAATAVYGVVLLIFNYIGKVDGPYPFFKVRKHKAGVTVAWMAALIVLITVLSLVVAFV